MGDDTIPTGRMGSATTRIQAIMPWP